MNKKLIDARIMGVPERIDNIHITQKLCNIPNDSVFIDANHDGCIPTAKRAWLKPTDSEYVMVLQDDILLCHNFISYCNRIVSAIPNAIISLHPPNQLCFHEKIGRYPTSSPYIQTKELTAQGIIMPTGFVEPCLASWDDIRRGDDTNILFWANREGIPVITTLPATIQHIGFASVFDPGHTVRGTDFFDQDPVNVNWDNSYYTSWTNVVKR